MSASVRSALPRSDQALLRWVGHVVPVSDRAEWLRSWDAELWWRRHPVSSAPYEELFTDLSVGLCRDAFWLRLASWERILRGTAAVCVLVLLSSCAVAAVAALCLYGGWAALRARVSPQFSHFLFAGPLVVFVTWATAEKRPVVCSGDESFWARFWREAFLGAKLVGILILAYMLSLDISSPLSFSFPNTCDYVQMLLFVLISICGLRWAFQDQEMRCKACLRLLDEPSRVGRPSHNLLEWSGNAFACNRGHGLLSVPELETSWHQTSEWTDQAAL